MNITVKKPGEALAKGEKRAEETITFTLDLVELLSTNEVATKVEGVNSKLLIEKTRIRRGTSLEITVPCNDIGAAQYLDYNISVLFETNMNNTRSAVFTLRVYK